MTTKLYEASDLNGPGRLRFPLRYPEEWYTAMCWYKDKHHPRQSMNEMLCSLIEDAVVAPYKERNKK